MQVYEVIVQAFLRNSQYKRHPTVLLAPHESAEEIQLAPSEACCSRLILGCLRHVTQHKIMIQKVLDIRTIALDLQSMIT